MSHLRRLTTASLAPLVRWCRENRPAAAAQAGRLFLHPPRGGFSRQLVLSEDIDTTAIQAEYRDGVLSVVLPVAETARPRKVAISTGDGSSPTTVEAQATGPRAA